MIESSETLFLTLAFIVPGFICDGAISMCLPREKVSVQRAIIRYLFLSSLNFALWSWVILGMTEQSWLANSRVTFGLVVFLIFFGSPFGIGLLFGYLSQKEMLRKFLFRIGFRTLHPTPTSWDYRFSKIRGGEWILVTLIDGSSIGGWFGSHSFASSEPGERDLYIEKMMKISDSAWEPIRRSPGIWVSGNEIRTIEFFTDRKEKDDESTKAEESQRRLSASERH